MGEDGRGWEKEEREEEEGGRGKRESKVKRNGGKEEIAGL